MMAVTVYASRSRQDTYLYVPTATDLAGVPEALLQRLQPLRSALELEITATTRLAQADAVAVLAQLDSEGYYLQLPPPQEAAGE